MAAESRTTGLWLAHRCKLAEAAALLVSLELAQALFLPKALPLLVRAVGLVCLLLTPGEPPGPAPTGRARWTARLGACAAVAALTAAFCYIYASPPAPFFLFAPIWAALLGVWRARPELTRLAGRALPLLRRWRAPLASFVCAALAAAVRWRLDAALGFALIVAGFGLFGPQFLPAASRALAWWPVPDRAHVAIILWVSASLVIYLIALVRVSRRAADAIGENLRWICLGGAWVWLVHPFFTVMQCGGPDARWYGTMMADMLAQVRAGVFPVFVGQSELQFNGPVYSLRVAPAFHYLGALVDALTLRSLGAFAIQNLLLSLVALAALCSTYLCLASLLRTRRWVACVLGILFFACPGVLGIAYNGDLLMSFMAVPMVPVAFCGLVQSFRDDSLAPLLLAAGALGVSWWAHAPIALWATLLVGGAMLVRLATRRPGIRHWLRAGLAASAFAAIAAYPAVSVAFYLPKAPGVSANWQVANPGNVVYFLRQAFPAILLPISREGRALGDFQLGYSLWALLGFCAWGFRRLKEPMFRVPFAVACAVALLLAPIPGLDIALWTAIPAFLRNATANWAMFRLYLILAAAVVFAGAVALDSFLSHRPRLRRWAGVALVLLCGWSLWDARKFAIGSALSRRLPEDVSLARLSPENAMLTRYSYVVFPSLPANFSHGVVDPEMENRVLSPALDAVIESNRDAPPMPAGAARYSFTRESDTAPALLADAPIVLEPGRRYIADFAFARPGQAHGVLQLEGSTFLREYELPDYGGETSFGSGGRHSGRLFLWTSGPAPERLTVRFFPSDPGASPDALLPFATFRVGAYDPASLPIRVRSWIPYEADVRSPAQGWLETPRMYQPWYRAWVDGKPAPVGKSPEGLAMVALPAGESRVRLAFEAPAPLAAAFYVSALSALAWMAAAPFLLARRPRADPPAAT